MRATLCEMVGVRFDKEKVDLRLQQMGIEDLKTRNNLLKEMEQAHTREAFLRAITKEKK